MKLLYKPFGLVLGILAGLVGRRTFAAVWHRIDHDDPPGATREDTPAAKAIAAVALEAAILASVRAAANRAGAKGWQRLTGSWPGEKPAEPPAAEAEVAVHHA